MLDICLLGTSGMMPLPKRHLASMMARVNGRNILIDCGEGTQVSIKKKGWSFKAIDLICFTHFHGDHIGGLPGLLLTMGNSERTDPLIMVGPRGLERVVTALRIIAPELPFEIQFIELGKDKEMLDFGDFRIEAFRANHRVPCYGYSIYVDRLPKFDLERAKALNLPVKFWSKLQTGETVEFEGNTYTPDMVMGAPRKGLKVSYCTDSRPTDMIAASASGADLFICEGMYGDPEKKPNALEHKHMMMYEAASLAKQAEVKELWFTHYSPSLVRPSEYKEEIRAIFPATHFTKDLDSVTLTFEED